MNLKQLPYNIPSGYNEVAVGDIVIVNSGENVEFIKDHIHVYEIVFKHTRYSKINMILKKCIFEGERSHTCHNKLERDWSWFIKHVTKIRWLRSPAEKILFGIKYE